MQHLSNERVIGFLHSKGSNMVNGENKEIILRGWGMGNWTNPEGFMVGGSNAFNIFNSGYHPAVRMERARTMNQTIIELCGSKYAQSFWGKWYANYITEADIKALAHLGYNSVRLPICSWAFLEEEPGVTFKEDSFEMLNNILDWCEKHKIYAILDLHAAPGGQSALLCDDSIDNVPHLFIDDENWERTMILWEEFAMRYKDRWIIGAYELLNEPLSLPRWDYLLPKLEEFYDECIARIRLKDKKHMLILEGHRFSSRMDIFKKNFDKEYNNWAICIHIYQASPEPMTLLHYMECSTELNVPLWIGETKGPNSWMTTLYEIAVKYHIGFNTWCWKTAKSENPLYPALEYKLPKDWNAVRSYSVGGVKPSYERSQIIFDELLENIKYNNCIADMEIHDYILRRPNIIIPAVAYDELPGRGSSFRGKHIYGNYFEYRLADNMKIVCKPGYVPKDKIKIPDSDGERNSNSDWENLVLEMTCNDFASYSIRDVVKECNIYLNYYCTQVVTITIETEENSLRKITLEISAESNVVKVGTIKPSELQIVKINVESGAVRLIDMRFVYSENIGKNYINR